MITWLNTNPGAFASLVSAIIAASVAVLVFAVTQFITGKRNRTAFLTSKFEELYLLLNEIGEANANHFDLMVLCLRQDQPSIQKLQEMRSVDLYGGNRAKKMIMLIRLYFPQLARIHQHVFAAERDYSVLKHLLRENEKVERKELLAASLKIGCFLELMERELIQNQSSLLRSGFFSKRYRMTTQAEIEKAISKAGKRPADGDGGSAGK